MRISHSHEFVFLAMPRTASTTVRKLLDEYSNIQSIHITKTTQEFPFYHHITASELKKNFEIRDWKWDRYKKFCVVRNPYDRIVSLYHHHLKLRDKKFNKSFLQRLKTKLSGSISFETYVSQLNPDNNLTISLKNFISDAEGEILVDNILTFENLNKELPGYLENFGIQLKQAEIPHLNASKNRDRYQKYYDDKTIKKVSELYEYEIKRFDYTF